MSGEATKAISNDVLWGGGRSPFSVSYGKVMMWFFLVSDALTFSGLLVAYGFKRHSLEAGHRMDKKGVIRWLFLTVIGGAFFVGSQAWEWSHFIHGGGGYIVTTDGAKYWVHNETHDTDDPIHAEGFHLIPSTSKEEPIGGEHEAKEIEGREAIDLWNARTEYVHGANMTANEYGPPQYANFFFFITGFHGFHVFSGVIINLIVLIMVVKGIFHRRGHYEMVEKAGLYWHFVDLVWVFVFTFFYLV